MCNYEVPEYIKELLDKEFLELFKKNLDIDYPVSCDGVSDELTREHYNMSEGTGRWHKALLDTSFELNKLQVIGYWDSLEWYDSDYFDSKLTGMIIDLKNN